MKVKNYKGFWDARTSKKMKKLGLAVGAMGTSITGAGAIFNAPQWLLISGFVLMVLGAPISILFTDDRQ